MQVVKSPPRLGIKTQLHVRAGNWNSNHDGQSRTSAEERDCLLGRQTLQAAGRPRGHRSGRDETKPHRFRRCRHHYSVNGKGINFQGTNPDAS